MTLLPANLLAAQEPNHEPTWHTSLAPTFKIGRCGPKSVLALEPQLIAWSEDFACKEHVLVLGRGLHYPIAMEGAPHPKARRAPSRGLDQGRPKRPTRQATVNCARRRARAPRRHRR